ncbi:MAG: Ig domain-containing protein, partial [Bacteroidales bacterium]|nr:Ig domain-containing protein [Bacteroidales bacterium]
PEITDYTVLGSSVTLNAPNGGTFDPNELYYMALVPLKYEFGACFDLEHEDGSVSTIIIGEEGGVEIERSKIHHVDLVINEEPEDIPVEAIELYEEGGEEPLEEGTTLTQKENEGDITLVAVVLPEDATNKEVEWTSDDEGVAIVVDGVVSPMSIGQATITVSSVENPEISASVVVIFEEFIEEFPVEEIELYEEGEEVPIEEGTLITISLESTLTLVAVVWPDYATNTDVEWSSSETEIATVEDGVVTPLSEGTVVITVSSVENPEISASVSVTIVGEEPVEPEYRLRLQKVWGHYGVAGVAGWPAYVSGADGDSGLDGCIRNATMDDEFVYIPKCAQVMDADKAHFTEAKIYKFSIADGSYQGLVQPSIDPAWMSSTAYSTFPVSCARVMKNTDSSINDGKDVLVCTNLCDEQMVRVYAWENGTEQEPILIASFESGRRFGDRISVEGTYQEGRIWYRSYENGVLCYIKLVPGYDKGLPGSHAWNWVEYFANVLENAETETMTEFTSYNNGEYGILSSNSSNGTYITSGTSTTKAFASLKRCFGWSDFSFEGKDYIAYLDMSGGTNLPIVRVIEGKADSYNSLDEALTSLSYATSASIAVEDQDDLETAGVYATNNQGDCVVRVIDGDTYILGATRGGIALFKVVMEEVTE